MTPLRGVDGEVYAIAQGSLVVSGFGVSGKDGSRIARQRAEPGRVPNGATVERAVPTNFATEPYVMLNLHTPDFTTAARLTEGINKLLGEGTAQAMDAVSVQGGRRRPMPASASRICRRSKPSRSSRAMRPRASSSIRAPAPW